MADTLDVQETLQKYDIYGSDEYKLEEWVDEGTKSYNDWLSGEGTTTTPINIDSYWNFHTHTSPRIEVEFRVPVLGKDGEYEWVNINSNKNNKVQVETSIGKSITVNSSATNNYFVSANIVDSGFKEVELVLYDRNFTNLMSLIESAIYSVNKSTIDTTSVNKKENSEYKISNGALNLNFFKAATPITTNLRIRYGYSENRGEQVIGNSEGNGYKGSIKKGTIIDRWNSTRDSTDSDKSRTLDDDAITAERVLQYFQQATVISNWDEYFITGLSTTLTETGLKYTIKAISTETFTLNGYKMYQQYSKIVGRPKTVMATLMKTFNSSDSGLMKLVWADSDIRADKSTINGSQIVPDYETGRGKNKVITEEEVNKKRSSVDVALNSLRTYLGMLKDLLACFKENQLNTLTSYFGGKNIEYQSLISNTDSAYTFESKSFMDLSAIIYDINKDLVILQNKESLKKVSAWSNSICNNYDFLTYVGNRDGGVDNSTEASKINAKIIWLSGIATKAYGMENFYTNGELYKYTDSMKRSENAKNNYSNGATEFETFLLNVNENLPLHWSYTKPTSPGDIINSAQLKNYYSIDTKLFGYYWGSTTYNDTTYTFLFKCWNKWQEKEQKSLADALNILDIASKEAEVNPINPSFINMLVIENAYMLNVVQDGLNNLADDPIINIAFGAHTTLDYKDFQNYLFEQVSLTTENSISKLLICLPSTINNKSVSDYIGELKGVQDQLLNFKTNRNPTYDDIVDGPFSLEKAWVYGVWDNTNIIKQKDTKNFTLTEDAKYALGIGKDGNYKDLKDDVDENNIEYQIEDHYGLQFTVRYKWEENDKQEYGFNTGVKEGIEKQSLEFKKSMAVYFFNRIRKMIYYALAIDNEELTVANITSIIDDETNRNSAKNAYLNFLDEIKKKISKEKNIIVNDFDAYQDELRKSRAINDNNKKKYIKEYLQEEAIFIDGSNKTDEYKLKEFYINDSQKEKFGAANSSGAIGDNDEKLTNYLTNGFDLLLSGKDASEYIISLEKKIAYLSSNLSNLEKKKRKLDSTNIGKNIELSLGSQESQNPELKLTKTVSSLLNDFCSQCQPCIDNKETELVNKNYVVQDETGNEKKVSVYENYPRYNLTWGVLGKNGSVPLIGFYYRRPIKQRYLRVYNWGTGNPRQHCVKALNVSSGSEFAMLQQYNIAETKDTGVSIKKIINGKVEDVEDVMPDNKSPCFFTTLLESKRDSNIFNNLYNSIYKGSITLLGDPSLKFQGIIQPYTYPIYLDIKLQREGKSWSSNDGDNTIMSYTSGFYVVTKITHNISTSGYTTTLDIMKYPGSDDQYIK